MKDLVVFGENRETLVIFEDGNCASLSAVVAGEELSGDGILGPNHDIEHPRVFSTITGEEILTFFAKNLATKAVELIYFALDGASRVPGSPVRIHLDRGEVKLVGYTVTEGPQLITIWSDKRIFRKNLILEKETEDGPGQFIAMLSAVSVEHPLSVVSVSSDYLAIYGANAGQEGSSLILYNLHFNVVQAKQFFKVYFSNSSISVVDSNILLAAGQTLAVVPFRISRAQLADMVGSQRNLQGITEVDKDYINEEDELEQVIEWDSQKFQFEDEPEEKIVQRVHSKRYLSRVTSEAEIEEKLSVLKRRDLVVEFVERDGQKELDVKVFSNPQASSFSREEFELLARELEASGASEFEISSKLISLAISGNAIDEAANCLRRYSCIPERKLVDCLIHAVKKENWDLLRVVLSVDFSHQLLVEELRSQLSVELVNPLLKRLLKFLESSELEERPRIGGRIWDGDEKMLEWFTAILDAHYHHLVMCGDPKIEKSLKLWRKILCRYWNGICGMKNFSPILYSISQNRAMTERQNTSKWYSIETVQLY